MALVLFPVRVATVALGLLGLMAVMLAATGSSLWRAIPWRSGSGTGDSRGAGRATEAGAAHSVGRTVVLLELGRWRDWGWECCSRVLGSIVYEATVFDPVVIAGALSAMVVIGAAAELVPARRALGVDPAVLLREE